MKLISTDEQKVILLDIMKQIHSFCTKNDIRYTLIYGTLLGAIRHKGYIPWDDDVDIAMPRADYEKFVKTFKSEDGIYKVYDYRQDAEYDYPYAKVADTRTILKENVCMKPIGVNVDIFPYDEMFDSDEKNAAFLKELSAVKNKYRIKLLLPSKKNKWWKRIAIRLLKVLVINKSLKDLARELCEVIERKSCDNSTDAAILTEPSFGSCYRSICPKSYFEEYVDVDFEGEKFRAIKEYDAWLTRMYGDYMTPPPDDQKTSPHTVGDVYWI